jgi:nucleoside-diphosphate-sugar epimerase
MTTSGVLVTGATGFVGRALVDALRRSPGRTVTAAVRREVAIEGVRTSRVGDLGPETDWRDALSRCDSVVHLAARVHMMADSARDPLAEYRRVNVAGTVELARQAAAAGVRRFVHLSSIKVNGEETHPGGAFREEDPPAPVDPYGISKAEAEEALLSLAGTTGMEVVIIRPPLVYGPGVRANFLTMTRWLARGVPLPLGAVDQNRRTLVALDNLIDLVITCMDHPAARNQLFLAGDAEDLSTAELLRRTAAALGVPARLVPVPTPLLTAGAAILGRRAFAQRLLGSLQVDISKSRRLLGWTPPISVDEGLRRAVRPLRGAESV